MLVRQLEEEVVKSRQHAKETNPEIKAHIEALQIENDHLTREVAILKETIKVIYFNIKKLYIFGQVHKDNSMLYLHFIVVNVNVYKFKYIIL